MLNRKPLLFSIAAIIAMIASLAWLGRIWWCPCGGFSPWIGDAASSHTSQHLFDPYSLTHVGHGFLFCGALALILRSNYQTRVSLAYRFAIIIGLECIWEIVENTPLVIDRYRNATAALGYQGDSIINSLGDVLACATGFVVATKLGWRYTLLLFALLEIGLLMTIRDCLLLNIVMLCVPIEWIKQWQLAA